MAGILTFNSPGVKSRRLGQECAKKYDQAIESSNSEEARLFKRSKSNCYTNIAREYQNTQLCDRIEDESGKNVCYTQVHYWNKSADFCETADQRDSCYHTLFVKYQDESLCKKIKNEKLRSTCLE